MSMMMPFHSQRIYDDDIYHDIYHGSRPCKSPQSPPILTASIIRSSSSYTVYKCTYNRLYVYIHIYKCIYITLYICIYNQYIYNYTTIYIYAFPSSHHPGLISLTFSSICISKMLCSVPAWKKTSSSEASDAACGDAGGSLEDGLG